MRAGGGRRRRRAAGRGGAARAGRRRRRRRHGRVDARLQSGAAGAAAARALGAGGGGAERRGAEPHGRARRRGGGAQRRGQRRRVGRRGGGAGAGAGGRAAGAGGEGGGGRAGHQHQGRPREPHAGAHLPHLPGAGGGAERRAAPRRRHPRRQRRRPPRRHPRPGRAGAQARREGGHPRSEVHAGSDALHQEAVAGVGPALGRGRAAVAQPQRQRGLGLPPAPGRRQGPQGDPAQDVLRRQEPQHARPGEPADRAALPGQQEHPGLALQGHGDRSLLVHGAARQHRGPAAAGPGRAQRHAGHHQRHGQQQGGQAHRVAGGAGPPGRREAAVAARPHGRDGEGLAALRLHALDQGRLGLPLPQLPARRYQAGALRLGPPLPLPGLRAHLRNADGLSAGHRDARLPRGDAPGPLLLDAGPRPGLPRRGRADKGGVRGLHAQRAGGEALHPLRGRLHHLPGGAGRQRPVPLPLREAEDVGGRRHQEPLPGLRRPRRGAGAGPALLPQARGVRVAHLPLGQSHPHGAAGVGGGPRPPAAAPSAAPPAALVPCRGPGRAAPLHPGPSRAGGWAWHRPRSDASGTSGPAPQPSACTGLHVVQGGPGAQTPAWIPLGTKPFLTSPNVPWSGPGALAAGAVAPGTPGPPRPPPPGRAPRPRARTRGGRRCSVARPWGSPWS